MPNGFLDCFAPLGRAIMALFQAAPVDNRGLYERVVAGAAPTPPQIVAWAQSPGGQAMNAFNFAALNNPNVLQVTHQWHNILNNGVWTWNPAVAAAGDLAACELLQGTKPAGECAAPAKALELLLKTANPYGLAQAAALFSTVTYTGAATHGFISNHPLGGVLNLPPNIYTPATGNRAAFYLWANHRVVLYNNEYFDPSYNTSYLNLPAMAQAQIAGSIDFAPATFVGVFVLDVVMTDDAAPPANKGFYISVLYNGAQLCPNFATAQQGGGGYATVYIGPFNPTPATGAVANNFHFSQAVDYLNGVNLH
jgi:hypothetical protein